MQNHLKVYKYWSLDSKIMNGVFYTKKLTKSKYSIIAFMTNSVSKKI